MSKLIFSPLLLLCLAALASRAQTADLILINGKVLTVDANDSIAEAVAIASGKIVAVGSNDAVKKLAAKNADLIVANDVTVEGSGFNVDTNIVTFFARDGREVKLTQQSKLEIAHKILDEALRLRAILRSKPAPQRAGD